MPEPYPRVPIRVRAVCGNNLTRVAHAASHENDRSPTQESFSHVAIVFQTPSPARRIAGAHCFGRCLFMLRQIERAVLGDGLFHNLSRPEPSPRLAPYF